MILYKYRQHSENTDLIFKNQQVWLAKPSDLNDPCECSLHELSPDWVTEKIREMKIGQMSGAIFFTDIYPDFTREIEETLPLITNFDEKYKSFRMIHEKHFGGRLSQPDEFFAKLNNQLNNIGIFSVASLSDHPLMWSHYGQEHKGMCLGFDLGDITPSTDPPKFLKIRYSDAVAKMHNNGFIQEVSFSIDENGLPQNSSSISLSDEAIRAAISTKSTCWDYESEWRYIEPEGNRTYPFPGPLVEIVFGLRCSEESRTHYVKLASDHLPNDVRLYNIQRIKNSFLFERKSIGTSLSKTAHPARN